MNKKQRVKNRATSKSLFDKLQAQQLAKTPCPRCGILGERHWIGTHRQTLQDIMEEQAAGQPKPESYYGFWTCPDLYDPETGRRLDEHIDPAFANPFAAGMKELLGDLDAVLEQRQQERSNQSRRDYPEAADANEQMLKNISEAEAQMGPNPAAAQARPVTLAHAPFQPHLPVGRRLSPVMSTALLVALASMTPPARAKPSKQ